MFNQTNKDQPRSNCSHHESRFTKNEEDEEGTNVPFINEELDLTSFDQFSPLDNSDLYINPPFNNSLDDSDIYSDEIFQPYLDEMSFSNTQQTYNTNIAFQNSVQQPKRTPFQEEFMRIYSGRANATMNKYMVNFIFKMINEIIEGLQLENEPFIREAQRKISYCYDNYQSHSPLILDVLKALKEFGVINYDEDHKESGKIDENDEKRRKAGVKFKGKKVYIPPHLIGKKNLGFKILRPSVWIKEFFYPKFKPVKDLIIQKLKPLTNKYGA